MTGVFKALYTLGLCALAIVVICIGVPLAIVIMVGVLIFEMVMDGIKALRRRLAK